MAAFHHITPFGIESGRQKRTGGYRPLADAARTSYIDFVSLNAPEIEQSREQISVTAKAMLSGNCSYIEGVRAIRGLFESACIDQFDEPFVAFVAIDSETDAVPVGRFRELWQPDAKVRFKEEWSQAEDYAQSLGEPACRAVIAWIERHPTYGS